MTELGIPVFNTPGANANAVKELVLCGMFLASRRIVDGINHMKQLGSQGLARDRVEKDKAMFGGQEIKGKKLAVIGLGTFYCNYVCFVCLFCVFGCFDISGWLAWLVMKETSRNGGINEKWHNHC